MQNSIILTQTDTTVGFISQNVQKLASIKERPKSKDFLKVYSSLKIAKEFHKVPNTHKNIVRRSSKTTFVIKNSAFRVVCSGEHYEFLKKIKWAYSTSANRSSESYNYNFCFKNSDIIIEDHRGLRELASSSIIKLNSIKKEKIR